MSNESNPLRTLVDFFRFKKIELSSESLVSKGIYSTLDYRAIMDSAPYDTKRKKLFLDEAVKKRKIKSLSKGKPGTIISRVLPESRNENNGIDVSLYISDKTGSRNAVKWRFNTFGGRSKCPVCKGIFSLTHASKCYGLENTDSLFTFDTVKELIERLDFLSNALKK
ncbi:hypothetical protein BB560_006046 [Smittium megazygosporum]|uniref:Uncharacterized protein n=1 Tax=Smittium megazygosporum TaxID=133381 RepID=A0A2T9YJT9_9FUNG|nr:hypothetical protein BB560_006046 [Smittium megazygosporum]